MVKELVTWGGRSSFEYDGSVASGTRIHFGENGRQLVTGEQYIASLAHFRGCTVNIGTSRDNPPEDSIGAWLQEHVTKTAIASYVGAILVAEGYAGRVPLERSRVQFK